MKLSPAQYVIHVFGTQTALAKAIRRSQGSVNRWVASKYRGGTGGLIPTEAQQAILRAAQRKGLDIQPGDLVVGRTIEKAEYDR